MEEKKDNNNNNLLQKNKKELFNEDIYPFINDMVDTFYTENCNELINNSISGGYDKSIFLMFVVMYFGIHLKLENKDNEEKKRQIKLLMTDFIKDPIKRITCINLFEEKFHNSFLQQKKIKK